MATATLTTTFGAPERAAGTKKAGFWARMLGRLIAAREMEARQKMAAYLAHTPDNRLAAAGLSAREIEMLRHGAVGKVDFVG